MPIHRAGLPSARLERTLVPCPGGLAGFPLGEFRSRALARRVGLARELVEREPHFPGVRDAEQKVLPTRGGLDEPRRVDGVRPELRLDDPLDVGIVLDLLKLGHVELRPFGGLLAGIAFPRGSARRGRGVLERAPHPPRTVVHRPLAHALPEAREVLYHLLSGVVAVIARHSRPLPHRRKVAPPASSNRFVVLDHFG